APSIDIVHSRLDECRPFARAHTDFFAVERITLLYDPQTGLPANLTNIDFLKSARRGEIGRHKIGAYPGAQIRAVATPARQQRQPDSRNNGALAPHPNPPRVNPKCRAPGWCNEDKLPP